MSYGVRLPGRAVLACGAAMLAVSALMLFALADTPAFGAVGHEYESQIAGPSLSEPFVQAWGMAFNPAGEVLVADAGKPAVDVFDPLNAFVPPQLVSGAFTGVYLRSVAVSASTGVVYVGESNHENVDVFKPEAGNTYKLLDEGQEDHFGNYVYVAVDNSTSAGDPRKGDVYVFNGALHVLKPNVEGELQGAGEELATPRKAVRSL